MGAVLLRRPGRHVTAVQRSDQVTLVDLLDRLLTGGVVLTGDVTISLAGVDLVHVSLRALISSVETLMEQP
ncbi:gas vesicle protein [Pseudonocardia sp. K10HN5]|uniref:Gas vesicle protein n=1 Tax=Pseudonocardia acidicola TaxID=2724939 RepID=A0ABX1S3R3_9PSEU|nr:gas vesicle protein [Pseudonocardia acidicola]